MKKLIIALMMASGPIAQATDWDLVAKLQEGCVAEAEELYAKGKEDAVKLQGAFGGNVSAQMVKSLEEAKSGFVMIQSSNCQADVIRKFKITTPYPID
ncbi:MAG: hypothetical protein AAF203_05950 [Pseudomonadota bacterium]